MIDEWLAAAAHSPWALPALFALVLGDAFLVVVPGEAAVTAFGALAVSESSPPIVLVIVVAAVAASAGDLCCYAIGRLVGLERWRWQRMPRIRAALDWTRARLDRRTAVTVFTARFIPFARLAVNLVAGATRLPFGRYAGVVAAAATGWALYQAVIGAIVAAILPGGPVLAVVVSVIVAIGLGMAVDAVLARVRSRRSPDRS